jgi:3-dehydroquinate synthase
MENKEFTYKPKDSNGCYRVVFSTSLKYIHLHLTEVLKDYKKPLLIVDDRLPESYKNLVLEIVPQSTVKIIALDTTRKSLERVVELWNFMSVEVPDIAIILGGGTIGDMSGFACSTYQRGIPRIFFPTTTLSQVDASIGGKTGIDYNGIKNAIGSVHYPLVTFNYVTFLDTLEQGEFTSGFSEIIKAAVLDNRDLFSRLTNIQDINSLNKSPELLNFLHDAALAKAQICEEHHGKKIRLLYGHSVGHALEKTADGYVRHGDCVAIGMNIEGALSVLMNIWSKDEWYLQRQLLRKIGLPELPDKNINLDKLVEKMGLYKKLADLDNLYFVLPAKIGRVNNQETTSLTQIPKVKVKQQLLNAIKFAQDN